jgi:hypothetical protein
LGRNVYEALAALLIGSLRGCHAASDEHGQAKRLQQMAHGVPQMAGSCELQFHSAVNRERPADRMAARFPGQSFYTEAALAL